MRSVANTTRKTRKNSLRPRPGCRYETVVDTFPLEQANAVLKMMKGSALRGGAALIL